MIFRSKADVDLSKVVDVIVRAVIRELHPGNNNPDPRTAGADPIDHFLQVAFDLVDTRDAERVVNPELEHEDINSPFQVRRQSGQSSASCAARLAHIDDFVIETGATE